MKKQVVLVFLIFVCFFTGLLCGVEKTSDISIAMVGDRVIWNNDVKERAMARGISYEGALLQLLEENLLSVQAKKEGIQVSKEEIENRFLYILNEWAKKGIDFIKFIKENGLTVSQYKEIIAEDIRREKLISEKINSKIKVSPIEVSKKMAEMETGKQILLRKRTFEDETSTESFIAGLKKDQSKLLEMESTGWINVNKIDPLFLSELYSAGKGNPLIKKQSGKTVVYVLAEEKENTPEQLYKKAYQEIRQEKFINQYSQYLNNLARSIPIKIFDESIAKKLSLPTMQ